MLCTQDTLLFYHIEFAAKFEIVYKSQLPKSRHFFHNDGIVAITYLIP